MFKLIEKMLLIVFLSAGVICCHAKLIISSATNDIYAGICAERAFNEAVAFTNETWMNTNSPILISEPLSLMFFCRTGDVQLLVPCNKSIFVKFMLSDATGHQIKKTSEGFIWGEKVGSFPKEPGMNSFNKMTEEVAVAGPDTLKFQGWPEPVSLPAPQELFDIKTSGVYYLTLEVHLMKQRFLGTNNWTWDHIVIPNFPIKIIKP